MIWNSEQKYRIDIDGLRAISVIVVILFHSGYLSYGFLGVDVFFVISGYLITGIIYRELSENRFSLCDFYMRRTRRIIPLALFVCLVSLTLGWLTMLPFDLEDNARSVLATSLFGNNMLQAKVATHYWGVQNYYRPLMHTWSLGVEEQYYLLYPLFFLFVVKKWSSMLLPLLVLMTVISVLLCFVFNDDGWEHWRFYSVPFRFYELSMGGIAAIWTKGRTRRTWFSPVIVMALVTALTLGVPGLSTEVTLLLTVLLSVGVLVFANGENKISSFILCNRPFVFLGKISFSLYMWHQVLLSFCRYTLVQEMQFVHLCAVWGATLIVSVASYWYIEQPFRDRCSISAKRLFVILLIMFVVVNGAALGIYSNAGVVRDVPELGQRWRDAKRGMHLLYNNRAWSNDLDFSSDGRIKVLVVGNSFGRDWVNVLLESSFSETLDVSYTFGSDFDTLRQRSKRADVVFWSMADMANVEGAKIDQSKLYVVGVKNFGVSNGVFYNFRGDGYFAQRTELRDGIAAKNDDLRRVWGGKYLDIIKMLIDVDMTVPVFTPSHEFISQDCAHLTEAGAEYLSELFDSRFSEIFGAIDQ